MKKNIEKLVSPFNGFNPLMAKYVCVPTELFSALLENIHVYIIP